MDVVDRIAKVRTSWGDKPIQPQRIKKMTVKTFGVEYPEPVKAGKR